MKGHGLQLKSGGKMTPSLESSSDAIPGDISAQNGLKVLRSGADHSKPGEKLPKKSKQTQKEGHMPPPQQSNFLPKDRCLCL